MVCDKMSIKALLLKQYELYPKMQIQDAIKLIFQNEFAGGHLVASEEDSLQRLRREYRDMAEKTPGGELAGRSVGCDFESIGNKLCRLHLAALKNNSISLETINKFFVNTARSVHGKIRSLEKKFSVLRQCCREGRLPFSLNELEDYLCSYKERGYPPVGHSEIYRSAYLPAYRIVKDEYCNFFEVFCRIDALMESGDNISIAVDGNSGAGKSSLASLIGEVYDCNILHMDDFFLTPELRTKERLQQVGGNVDYIRFKNEVIDGINSGRKFQYRGYDCGRMGFGQPVTVIPKKLNIIEGSYSMHPTLISNYHLKIFLSIDKKTQTSRILERNGPQMLDRFVSEWIPLEDRYFSELNIREQSDLVLSPE